MSIFVPPFGQAKVDQWCLVGCRCKGTTPGEGQAIAKAHTLPNILEITGPITILNLDKVFLQNDSDITKFFFG